MRWALGCAFNMDDMLIRFPYAKLQCTCQQCKEISNDLHKKSLVKKVFKAIELFSNKMSLDYKVCVDGIEWSL